jgi:hypothetical protein
LTRTRSNVAHESSLKIHFRDGSVKKTTRRNVTVFMGGFVKRNTSENAIFRVSLIKRTTLRNWMFLRVVLFNIQSTFDSMQYQKYTTRHIVVISKIELASLPIF